MSKYKNIILLAFMLAIFTITTTRAAITCITYDEASNYMHYSRPFNLLIKSGFDLNLFLKNFAGKLSHNDNSRVREQDQKILDTGEVLSGSATKPLDAAQRFDEKFKRMGLYGASYWEKIKKLGDYVTNNNHILNTLCMSLVEFLFNTHYDEFAIRLPVLIFFAIYLFAVYRCYKNNLISFTCAFLLCGNYYLCEFYGLARGYGYAHTLLFLVCIAYIYWQKSNFNANKYLIALMTLLLLAASANTISLLIFPAFGALTLFRLYQQDNLKKFILSHKIFVSLFFIIAFMLVGYHFFINTEGKPGGGGPDFYNSVILSYAKMFAPYNLSLANILACAMLGAALIAFVISIIKNKIKNCDFVLMLIIFVLTILLMQFLTHKGYMADRAALPFYCFIIFALRELFRDLKIKYLNISLCVLCLISFASQIDLHATRDWHDNYHCRDKILKAYMTGVNYEVEERIWATEKFYDDKYAEIIK